MIQLEVTMASHTNAVPEQFLLSYSTVPSRSATRRFSARYKAVSMQYDLDGKKFRVVSATSNGQVDECTIFKYHQDGNRVWAEYSGGAILVGHLVATQNHDGSLEILYHHIAENNQIMYGKCHSIPSRDKDGKLRFEEHWEWLNGDCSHGQSTILEL